MSGENPAIFCSSSLVAASGEPGKTIPPTVCTLAILASLGARYGLLTSVTGGGIGAADLNGTALQVGLTAGYKTGRLMIGLGLDAKVLYDVLQGLLVSISIALAGV